MLGAGEGPVLDDVEVVAVVALPDDDLAGVLLQLLHGVEHDLELLRVEAREHEGLLQPLLERVLDLRGLRVGGRLEVAFLVPGAEDLGAHGGAWPFGLVVLDHLGQVLHVLVLVRGQRLVL